MTELLHGQEVIFSQVYRRKKIGEKLIKWLCVSCLATLNYSCLFDCCVWRIYWEVEHRGSRSLSALLHGVQLPKAEKYLNVKTQGCIKVTEVVWAACYWHYFYDCCWFSKTCFCVLFLRTSDLSVPFYFCWWYRSEVGVSPYDLICLLPICGLRLAFPSNSI